MLVGVWCECGACGYAAGEACNLYVSSHIPRQPHYLTLQTFRGTATEADPASISPCDLPETYGSYFLWVLMGVNAQRSGYGAVKYATSM